MKNSINLELITCVLFLSFSCQQEEIISYNPEQQPHERPALEKVPGTNMLNIQIEYPDSTRYDSAYIVFQNSNTELKQQLILDKANKTARGTIANIDPGQWDVSASFFSTIEPQSKSLENNSAFGIGVSKDATDLILVNGIVSIKEGSSTVTNPVSWDEFYYYQLFLQSDISTPEGFVRLPKDPTDPFVEIRTFEQKWIYAYVDRSFYNSSIDGTTNHFLGGAAFEIYGQYGDGYDRLSTTILDSTSLGAGISQVVDQKWTMADCIIVIAGVALDQELLLYHVWDYRATNGRTKSPIEVALSKGAIKRRKAANLHSGNP